MTLRAGERKINRARLDALLRKAKQSPADRQPAPGMHEKLSLRLSNAMLAIARFGRTWGGQAHFGQAVYDGGLFMPRLHL
jgi:hypothetical protein